MGTLRPSGVRGTLNAAIALGLLSFWACADEPSFHERANDKRIVKAQGQSDASRDGDDPDGPLAGADAPNPGDGNQADLEDEDGKLSDGKDGKGDKSTVDDIETVEELALACKEATAKKKLKTKTVRVEFPATIECDWDKNGNGERNNATIRARREQDFALQIPKAARLCDMTFDFPEQRMLYDDEIFLLLDRYILAASQDYQKSETFPGGLARDGEFVEYKWDGGDGLYDLYYDHAVAPAYCLGSDAKSDDFEKTCLIPPTEEEGKIQLDIPANLIKKLSIKTGLKYDQALKADGTLESINLGFVTIGDNDDGDCEHADFNFTVQVDYIE